MAFESTKDELGNIWNPTKNEEGDPRTEATDKDFIDGYYVEKKVNVGVNNANLYLVKTDDGEVYTIWGTTALNQEMDKRRIGDYVRIKWLGKKLTKKGAEKKPTQRVSTDSFHAWEVFVDKEKGQISNNVPANSFAKTETDENDLPFN